MEGSGNNGAGCGKVAGQGNPDKRYRAGNSSIRKQAAGKIERIRKPKGNNALTMKFNIGDSVMIYPDKKIGIVCEKVNEKGVLRVQMPDRKIWINQKRVKLHVAASELYPEDYDFSIIFETAQNRKILHDMSRKLTDEVVIHERDE